MCVWTRQKYEVGLSLYHLVFLKALYPLRSYASNCIIMPTDYLKLIFIPLHLLPCSFFFYDNSKYMYNYFWITKKHKLIRGSSLHRNVRTAENIFKNLKKVRFYLFTWRRRMVGDDLQLHSFLKSGLGESKRSKNPPPPPHHTFFVGGLVGTRVCIDVLKKTCHTVNVTCINCC
jgi:hypothetical protein